MDFFKFHINFSPCENTNKYQTHDYHALFYNNKNNYVPLKKLFQNIQNHPINLFILKNLSFYIKIHIPINKKPINIKSTRFHHQRNNRPNKNQSKIFITTAIFESISAT